MNFGDAIKTCFSKYADFTGRASRSEYWWFALFCFIGAVVSAVVHDFAYALFTLAILLPSLAAGARRLHDTGRSGWLQLVMLIPIIGGLILLYFLVQPSEGENRFGMPAIAA